MIKKGLLILSALLLCFGEAAAFTIDEAVDQALENNHGLKRYKLLEKSTRETVEAARAGFLPSVDLGYSYELHEEDLVSTGSELSSARVAVSYNLFNGHIDANRLSEAKARTRAAEYKLAAVEADVALAAREAFIEVLRANQDIATAKESVRLFERQRRDTALFYREGLLAKNDLLSVEVDLSTARQRLLQVKRNRVVAEKKLERRIGADIADGVEFTDFPGLPAVEESSFETLKEEMLDNRSELKYLNHIKEAYEYGKEAIAGGDLPRVDIVLSHSRYGDSLAPIGWEAGYNHDTSALLKVSWNVFDGYYRKHKINEATYLADAVEEEIQDAEDEMLLQLNWVLEDYKVGMGKLEEARVAATQAEENYRVTKNRFKHREATTTDLLDANNRITRARTQRNQAFYSLHGFTARLIRVLGR